MAESTANASQISNKHLGTIEALKKRPREKKNHPNQNQTAFYSVTLSSDDPSATETVLIFDPSTSSSAIEGEAPSQGVPGSIFVELDENYVEPDECELVMRQLQQLSSKRTNKHNKIVKKKKIIWDPSTKDVVATEVDVNEPLPLSPPKKKRSEVDRLLADEGVIEIMRDQQVAIDDGYLLNITKGSKTRNQRMKQEEPERTPNDWNICSMIARRRSSSFSEVESINMELPPPPAPTAAIKEEPGIPIPSRDGGRERGRRTNRVLNGDLNGQVFKPQQFIAKEVPKSKRRSIKVDDAEMAGEEETAKDTVPLAVPKSSPKRKSASVRSPKTKSPEKGAGAPELPANVEGPEVTPQVYTKLKVQQKERFIQVTIDRSGGKDNDILLCPIVCEELVSFLKEQKINSDCKLVLLGPLKFTSSDQADPPGRNLDLLKALARFPKPIFAAVQGTIEGLGLTMLPLCDMVFGKYGTEFSFAKDPLLGISIFLNSPKINRNTISEFLFLGASATSTRALECGLIMQEISSRNDMDFEKKVIMETEEVVANLFTERIELFKKLWTDRNLETLLGDLDKECMYDLGRNKRLNGSCFAK